MGVGPLVDHRNFVLPSRLLRQDNTGRLQHGHSAIRSESDASVPLRLLDVPAKYAPLPQSRHNIEREFHVQDE
jgi:hypothetical protein